MGFGVAADRARRVWGSEGEMLRVWRRHIESYMDEEVSGLEAGEGERKTVVK